MNIKGFQRLKWNEIFTFWPDLALGFLSESIVLLRLVGSEKRNLGYHIKHKTKMHRQWRQWYTSWGDYRDMAWECSGLPRDIKKTRMVSSGTQGNKRRWKKLYFPDELNRRPGYSQHGEGWGTQQLFCLGLHWQVLQPHCPLHRIQRQGLGEWRTAHHSRRWGSRPSKEPEGAQVPGTSWGESKDPEGNGRWSC